MPDAILVAGGGLAGLTAALRALERGASVTLLEKGDRPGGSLVLSSGFAWSYRDATIFRDQASGGDPVLQGLILDGLEDGLGWLEAHGAPMLTRETGNPLTFGARLDPRRAVDVLVRRIRELGGRVLTGTAMDGLATIPDGGRVVGVESLSDGKRRTEEADAVILASGGFAANPDLVARHIVGGPGEMLLRAHPRSTGDGFLAATEAGAMHSSGLDEFYGRNLPAPPARFSPEQWVEVSQLYGRHAVAINRKGERFADEAADWSETALVRATARQPSLRAWYLLDATGLESRVRERTAGEMVAAAERAGGTVLRAEDVEELSEKLALRGVSGENTLSTLREYNGAVAAGLGDELAPPRSEPAVPLRVAPFVAVEVAPAITHTIGGLAVDENCHVLRSADRRPIPGLYAAGVEVGGVSTGGYTSGLAAAIVFGLVAAEAATRPVSSR